MSVMNRSRLSLAIAVAIYAGGAWAVQPCADDPSKMCPDAYKPKPVVDEAKIRAEERRRAKRLAEEAAAEAATEAQRNAQYAAEEQAWSAAQRKGDVAAYEFYLSLYPQGRYVGDARAKVASQQQEAAQKHVQQQESDKRALATNSATPNKNPEAPSPTKTNKWPNVNAYLNAMSSKGKVTSPYSYAILLILEAPLWLPSFTSSDISFNQDLGLVSSDPAKFGNSESMLAKAIDVQQQRTSPQRATDYLALR